MRESRWSAVNFAERTAREWADHLGVTVDAVYKAAEQHGSRCCPSTLTRAPGENAIAWDLVRFSDDTAKNLANAFGVTVSAVYQAAVRHGQRCKPAYKKAAK